jgi:uncharacterized RDD family membrane protein YckC
MTDPVAAEESMLERRLAIETPERIRIVHDLAGIGSRFAAGCVDVFLLSFVFCVLGGGLVLVFGVARPRSEETMTAFGLAAVGVFFAILALYYSFFELMWSGQTPGKRLFKLRVVSHDGGPASAASILVRNVLRLVDGFPFAAPYGLGGAVMFVSRSGRRIGDFAAGTIVVRERTEALAAAPPAGAADGDEAFPQTDADRAREFVLRAPQLFASSRAALARSLAADIASRHGVEFADPEQFLRAVAHGRSLREMRGAQGPRP